MKIHFSSLQTLFIAWSTLLRGARPNFIRTVSRLENPFRQTSRHSLWQGDLHRDNLVVECKTSSSQALLILGTGPEQV